MRRFAIATLLLATLGLAGCGQSVPPDKQAYIGEWQSNGMAVNISQSGKVIVVKEGGGNASTRVEAPLQGFDGNDFIVGLGPMKTTYRVSVPPHEDNGEWKMTVDGKELTRVEE
ncbi:hypothetical protein [Thermomonas sp.]|uniref:hypothetical protein n=1 Tax=Thermomonas sp. TaxID=1971895 RepID=UPI00262754B4|nr:hypothetical protein [Thermomonas sp.]